MEHRTWVTYIHTHTKSEMISPPKHYVRRSRLPTGINTLVIFLRDTRYCFFIKAKLRELREFKMNKSLFYACTTKNYFSQEKRFSCLWFTETFFWRSPLDVEYFNAFTRANVDGEVMKHTFECIVFCRVTWSNREVSKRISSIFGHNETSAPWSKASNK